MNAEHIEYKLFGRYYRPTLIGYKTIVNESENEYVCKDCAFTGICSRGLTLYTKRESIEIDVDTIECTKKSDSGKNIYYEIEPLVKQKRIALTSFMQNANGNTASKD